MIPLSATMLVLCLICFLAGVMLTVSLVVLVGHLRPVRPATPPVATPPAATIRENARLVAEQLALELIERGYQEKEEL